MVNPTDDDRARARRVAGWAGAGLPIFLNKLACEFAAIREEEKAKQEARVGRVVNEFTDYLKRPLPTCSHTLGDLFGGGGAVTQCGGCVKERREERARAREGGVA